MISRPLLFNLAAIALFLVSCGSDDGSAKDIYDANKEAAEMASDPSQPAPYSDLKMFELKGRVKECVQTSYYSVEMKGDTPQADTSAVNRRETRMYFNELGGYVTSSNEKLKRDSRGRITYWRDSRPNNKNTHPGLLRDTLNYEHVNGNVIKSDGMGEYAVTVYDNEGRVVGMYSEPDVKGASMSAFNVILESDENGNWTRRLTVWTTHSAGGRPHISYTMDTRKITYY